VWLALGGAVRERMLEASRDTAASGNTRVRRSSIDPSGYTTSPWRYTATGGSGRAAAGDEP